jgi:hypothetical protein
VGVSRQSRSQSHLHRLGSGLIQFGIAAFPANHDWPQTNCRN